MSMKRLFPLFIVGIFAALVSAYTISGTISEKNGDPIPAAHIFLPSEKIGTAADIDGKYSLEVPPGVHRFKITALGYQDIDTSFVVSGDKVINFIMRSQAMVGDVVVVSASRIEQNILDTPISTTVAKGDVLAERTTAGMDDAIKYIPGVTMNKYQISIRNSSGYSQGCGSRVAMLIDGVPVTAGDTGEIKWDALPIGQVQQMEVVKSAGSALYGSNAMGGVINFITRRPEKKESYRVITEIGYWDKPAYDAWRWWGDDIRHYHRLSLEHARKLGNWGLLFNLEEKRNDSYRQADDYYRGQFFGKATCNLNGANKLSILTNIAYEDRGSGLAWKGQSAALEVDSTKLSDRVWSSKFQLNTVYDGSSDGGKKHWSVKGHINYNCWYDALSDGADGYDNHYSKSTRAGVDAQYTLIPFENHRFTSGTDLSMAIIDANIFGKRTGFGRLSG